MQITPADISHRQLTIERIPTWQLWWTANRPTVQERIETARLLLSEDIQRGNKLA